MCAGLFEVGLFQVSAGLHSKNTSDNTIILLLSCLPQRTLGFPTASTLMGVGVGSLWVGSIYGSTSRTPSGFLKAEMPHFRADIFRDPVIPSTPSKVSETPGAEGPACSGLETGQDKAFLFLEEGPLSYKPTQPRAPRRPPAPSPTAPGRLGSLCN